MTDRSPWFLGAVALVTGSPGRVGRAIALQLADCGIHVAVHYRSSQEGAAETVKMVRDRGVRAEMFAEDLGGTTDVCHQLIADVTEALGAPSILVNNASSFEASTLESLSAEAWDQTMHVNLRAPVFLAQAMVGSLTGARGHLIQIVDWRADNPVPGHLAYTLSKAGLAAMTRLLAQELAPNVQVNAIAPGAILPPPGCGPEHLDQVAERIPLKRSGSPAEIANAVEYLVRSDFVTGEVLHITGGQQLGVYD